MSRILTMGDLSPSISLNNIKNTEVDATDMSEVSKYINRMSSSEKKNYVAFLAKKAEEERVALQVNIDAFNKANKNLVVIDTFLDTNKMLELYDEVVIPLIKGTYASFTYEEEKASKELKKDLIKKLTKAYFEEYLEQNK